jgi:hypothetical protein
MKELIMTVALLLMVPALASAQNADQQYRGQGYVFIGEGTARSPDNGLHGNAEVGGGGEVLLFRGFGVGGELGAMGRPAHGVGVLSIDPSYRFLRKSKVVPFVEGGYTRTFANSDPFPPSNLFNFGGGINYWAFKRVGLRLEFRDLVRHVSPLFVSGQTDHYWGLRIGLAFR